MADTGGGGGGMRRLVLAEISLSLPHILPKAFLLLLPVMGSNAQKIRHLVGGPGLVYFSDSWWRVAFAASATTFALLNRSLVDGGWCFLWGSKLGVLLHT